MSFPTKLFSAVFLVSTLLLFVPAASASECAKCKQTVQFQMCACGPIFDGCTVVFARAEAGTTLVFGVAEASAALTYANDVLTKPVVIVAEVGYAATFATSSASNGLAFGTGSAANGVAYVVCTV